MTNTNKGETSNRYQIKKDVVYKALTRQALIFGVPFVPFIVLMGIIGIIASRTSIAFLIAAPFVFVILKILVQIDEFIFQILKLKTYTLPEKFKAWKINSKFNGSYYTSSRYDNENLSIARKKINPELQVLDFKNANNFSKVIPFSSQIQDGVIITKDGYYVSTWEVEGISYETRDDKDLDSFKESLNTTLKSLVGQNLAVYTHCVRDYGDIQINDEFDDELCKEINDKYLTTFTKDDLMENTLFITLVFRPLSFMDKMDSKTSNLSHKQDVITKYLNRFSELSERFEAGINKFGIYKLKSYYENNVEFSHQIEFYNFLITNKRSKIRVLDENIYNYIGNVEMLFKRDLVEIRKGDDIYYARSIEIKEWVEATYSGILNILMNVKCRYVLTQSFALSSKSEAKKTITKQSKNLQSSLDDGVNQVKALEDSKEQITDGVLAMGEHHFSLMLYADSIEDIKNATREVISCLESDLGFLTTFSTISFEETYFAQLPSNFIFRPRVRFISSLNFAGMNSLHNNPLGKSHGNSWGSAVAVMKTMQNQPFYFNFHQTIYGKNDFGDSFLGHTLIVGKSGSGKTATVMFLMSQLTKFNRIKSFPKNSKNKKLTMIYFDKDYGAEIGVRAFGGQYNKLKNGENTGFNPFSMESTKANISHLSELIQLLASINGETLTAKEKMEISSAVNSVMSLEKDLRKFGITRLLENIQDDRNDENSLYKRLQIWKLGNEYGWVFDNEKDSLGFNDKPIYGFDGTEILDNKAIISPISYYLLYRIQQIADGRRLVIFMDEFWKWLEGDAFRDFTRDGLKTLRKQNGFLVCATQSPDEILKSPISRSIVEQSETLLLLPNKKADEKDYVDGFKVSYKEYKTVQSLDDDSRTMLIKKGAANDKDTRGNTVLVKMDLKGIGRDLLKILSADTDNIAVMESIIDEVGDDPNVWVPIFRDKCK